MCIPLARLRPNRLSPRFEAGARRESTPAFRNRNRVSAEAKFGVHTPRPLPIGFWYERKGLSERTCSPMVLDDMGKEQADATPSISDLDDRTRVRSTGSRKNEFK